MEQLSIDLYDINDYVEPTTTELQKDDKDNLFGCCFRYRECSAVKKCLIADRADSKNCIYRKNLEKGKIFYGKNADEFNPNVYNKLLNTYKSLDLNTRQELNCIIIYFEKYRTPVLWYSSSETDLLNKLGLCELTQPKRQILELCDNSFLNTFLSDEVKALLNQEAKARENKKNVRAKKQDIINWLMCNYVREVEEYLKKFTLLSFSSEIRPYIFEIYYDFLAKDAHLYTNDIIKRLPMKKETNFIKTKDDNNDF